MTSANYHSTFTIDLNEDQPHQLIFYSKAPTEDASSSSSMSYPNFLNPNSHLQEPPAHCYHQPLPHHEQVLHHGSWDDHQPAVDQNTHGENLTAVCKKDDDDQREKICVKWMSSKMRLMRKMMRSDDQTAGNNNNNRAEISMHKSEDAKGRLYLSALQEDNNNTSNSIRVCTDCNTTKTPLWRSGPGGPKSLCNACGIRQRKARRALAAAQANANGTILSAGTVSMKNSNDKVKKNKNKEKKTNNNNNNNSHLPFKKRCKFTSQSRANRKNKLCFEDLSSTILSKNSAFQQLFPQDEKEAAILLMALSYGLVHG
ncbi:GATA transcription factor 21 [Mercurialis annua]|uniref:GATA transcription factor 21 n=1 Tax=Mercurialis annua TaxID=3986 RepID=UPI00215EA324|nr:GATA transcription factor 21 [Mercurialis annua]